MDADGFPKWVASVNWRFAKSMPGVPHEYTVGAWADTNRFQEARQFILENGYMARWKSKPPNRYYDLDGWRYWAYESLINRQEIGSKNSEVTRVDDAQGTHTAGLHESALMEKGTIPGESD